MDLLNNNTNTNTDNVSNIDSDSKVNQTPPLRQISLPTPASNPNPFVDRCHPQPDLISVSRNGTTLVTNITKYLSTLPHPIEVVEELVAVCAVTSSLLTSLNSTILRFPHLNLSPTKSFIATLCLDILFAFKLLGDRVQEAKRMRVFEPNDVGLVRLPRCAWTLVLGTEAKVAALRSRLYVEKYRVRVLIEAVAYEGLRSLEVRSKREDDELKSLRRMLPLVAERLVGVQRDYKPRLMRLNGMVVDETMVLPESVIRVAPTKTVVVPAITAPAPAPTPVPAPAPAPVVQPEPKVELKEEPCSEKMALKASVSTHSLASTSSSITIHDDSILETWLLRCNRPKKDLKSRTSIFGIPLLSTHTYSTTTHYVKPLPSTPSETASILASCQTTQSPSEHLTTLRLTVLEMDDDAQWEIQKLIEAREKACSSGKVSRKWEVIGLLERNRRKLSPCKGDRKWWSLKKEKERVTEWVLVLRGETADTERRLVPEKHENAWKEKDKPVKAATPPSPPPPSVPAPAQVQKPIVPVQQPQQGTILRHVENRRVLTIEEAEFKMREIVSDLFVQNDDFETETEDEESEVDEDEESEIEDMEEVED